MKIKDKKKDEKERKRDNPKKDGARKFDDEKKRKNDNPEKDGVHRFNDIKKRKKFDEKKRKKLAEENREHKEDLNENKQSNELELKIEKIKNAVDGFETRFGWTTVEVRGLNFGKLLTRLGRVSRLTNVRADNGVLTFTVRSKDSIKIIALLNELCYNYKIKKRTGAMHALLSTLFRPGLVLGMTAAVCALSLYPRFVINIETSGIITEEASAVLADYGITEGAFLARLDCAAVSSELLKLEGVAFASVEKRGTSVYVTLRYELPKEELISFGGGDVKATKSAMVTRVIVYGGTAEAVKGDKVEIGKVLIGAYLTVGEEKVPADASGEVYGEVEYLKTVFYPDVTTKMVCGGIKKYTRLSVFGSKIKIPPSPFENFQTRTETYKNDFFAPYTVTTVTYTELVATECGNTLTPDEMRKNTLSSLAAELPADALFLSGTAEAVRSGGGWVVTARASVEERVDI